MWTESIQTNTIPDDQLLLRRYVLDHDLQAFDALANRYLEIIRFACRQEISNPDLAEDAVSATLLVFAEKARSIRPDASLRAWLTRTSHLVAKNVRRREESQVNYAKRLRTNELPMSESALSIALDQALTSLSDRHRTALSLRFGEQQSLVEVGKSLGISEDAARMLVQRGLKLLRKALHGAGVPVGLAGASLLLHRQALAEKGLPMEWPLRASAFGLTATAPLLFSPLGLLSLSAAVALPLFAWPTVHHSFQARQAQSIIDQTSHQLTAYSSLQADLETKVTLNGKTFQYASKLMAQKPGFYRTESSSPYHQRTVCIGQTVYTLQAIGTADEGYTKIALSKLPGSSNASIDAFLGWDVIKNTSKFLVGLSPKVKADEIVTREIANETMNGKSFRVVEVQHPPSKASIKLYFAPNGVIEREDAVVQVLAIDDDGHGNRVQKYATETFSFNLKNIRLGAALPAETFTFDESKYRSLMQPDVLTVGMNAPDFVAANPQTGETVHLKDLLSQNKAILLDFWFAGCAPCRAEMPKLSALQTQLSSKGLKILCVNGMDTSDVIKSIFEKENLTMMPVLAPMRKYGGMDQCAWDYGVRAYPTQFLINPKGKIVWAGHGIEADLMTELSNLGVN